MKETLIEGSQFNTGTENNLTAPQAPPNIELKSSTIALLQTDRSNKMNLHFALSTIYTNLLAADDKHDFRFVGALNHLGLLAESLFSEANAIRYMIEQQESPSIPAN